MNPEASGIEASAIEGGDAGGSSARQAAERRSVIKRLTREADWLESVVADQRTTARLLATLSDESSVLHDLKWADADSGTTPHVLDHLVVTPGGLFAIVSRRFTVPITSREGQLFVGDATLADELVAVVRAAQSLANALGTPVAPVMGFHGGALPDDAPAALQGVLLCPIGEVAQVIERFPHTALMAHERSACLEQVLPLLVTKRSEPRHQQDAPPAAAAALAPLAATVGSAGRSFEPAVSPAAKPSSPANSANSGNAASSANSQSSPPASPGRRWPVVLVVLLLVAAVIGGGLWWFLGSSSSDSSSRPAETTSTAAVDGSSPSSADLAAAVTPPTLTYSTVCPAEGEGWQIVPDWPGDVEELSSYDVEVQDEAGTWTHLTLMESRDLSVAALSAQPPAVTLTMRVTAVMNDLSRSEGVAVEVTTPDEAC